MKAFWTLFDKLLNVMAVLAGVILVFIVGAVCYTIGMRYFFKQTTIWIMQTTEYALLWIVFLATTWLLREGGHITTDIIYSHLSNKTRLYLDAVMFIIGGLACAVMLYFRYYLYVRVYYLQCNRCTSRYRSQVGCLCHHSRRKLSPYDPVLQDGMEPACSRSGKGGRPWNGIPS